MNFLIRAIQKLNADIEKWEDYYSCYAEVNKSSGNEYFNARTNITQNTYNVKVTQDEADSICIGTYTINNPDKKTRVFEEGINLN